MCHLDRGTTMFTASRKTFAQFQLRQKQSIRACFSALSIHVHPICLTFSETIPKDAFRYCIIVIIQFLIASVFMFKKKKMFAPFFLFVFASEKYSKHVIKTALMRGGKCAGVMVSYVEIVLKKIKE